MAKFDFRHGIARYQEDGVGNPNFLIRSGNYVNLLVQPDPTVFLVAHFDENYIYTENVSVSQAWGPYAPGSPTVWMYWNIDFITGVISRHQTTVDPVSQGTAPINPALDQHWFDTSVFMQKVWNGSTWTEVLRVFSGQLVNGTVLIQYPLGSQVGLNNMVTYAGFPIVDPEQKPVQKFRRDRRGQFITTETPLASQFSRNANFRVEAAINQAEALEPVPVHFCIAYADYSEVVLARNTVPSRPAIGIAAEDMDTGEVRSFITKGFVTNDVDWDWSAYPAGTPIYCGATGELVTDPPQAGSIQRMGIIATPNTVYIDTTQIIHYNSVGNLIQLNLDKTTGELVAQADDDGGIPPGTVQTFGYVYVQPMAAQVWTIVHNANSDKVIAQVYDLATEQIFPNNVTILDVNTVQIDFTNDQEGRAHLILFT